WAVDGIARQTNIVAAGSPASGTTVFFNSSFAAGVHQVTVSVADTSACAAVCSTTVSVSSNAAPTINCQAPITLSCAGPTGAVVPISVNVADANGDRLVVVWTVDGIARQTNIVAAGSPPSGSTVSLTNNFSPGPHQVLVSVSDTS